MITLTMLNQKGGVGKTSLTLHMAGALAASGKRVLLLDNDPQGSLTQGFWGKAEGRRIDPSESIAALYDGSRPFADQVVKPTGVRNLWIVPGSKAADRYNVPLPQECDDGRWDGIRSFVADLAEEGAYDLAVLDCPPNLYGCSWAALSASDHLMVPTQPEDYGMQGLADVQDSLALVRANPNPRLHLLGFVLTRISKKAVHQLYEEQLRSQYGDLVFEARMPDAVGFIEAIAARLPVSSHKPKGAPAKAAAAIAAEMLARIEAAGSRGNNTLAEVA